jgi:hypothetical protein
MHSEHTPPIAPDRELRHLEELLDDALADSFPASDPLSSLTADDPPAPLMAPNGATHGHDAD